MIVCSRALSCRGGTPFDNSPRRLRRIAARKRSILAARTPWVRGGRRFPGSKRYFNEDPPRVWACCTLNHTQAVKRPPTGVERKFGEEVPAHVSSSLSDRGSKGRCPSQNSPCVASETGR
ncbi:hypothetical protein AVEN_69501-1 [Araneus ventricosus]|uniref:Uncharacterized protein n=1 Tax=Araneus ventricosus TaxID=182803 RepID=A0A4Y2NHT5_ARAVE|nr:hypothetical protein AVEN_69501-1 [Araneus ventricosus]